MFTYASSKSAFERAQKSIPGGVNSPVRAFKNVGGTPIFLEKAEGAYLYDIDGNRYIDFVGSWGPMILGHAYGPVIEAVQKKAASSTSFGAPTVLETSIAELIKSMVPGIDLVRMVNSGTEACMSAVRLARGYTSRNKFIKFDGCYHGHADMFLVSAGSGVATLNIQQVPGVTAGTSNDTLIAPYNNLDAVRRLFKENPNEIAAIIVEPVAGNMGCVLPNEDFLTGLRTICDEEGALLIFDEVMTGFRQARGGAQERFGIQADIVAFGKVIGAGLPVGAFAGRYEIMSHIAPLGNVYQAGTLSGNPLAMVAGYTLLKELNENPVHYEQLNEKATYLKDGILRVFGERNMPVQVNQKQSMMSLFFNSAPVVDFATSAKSDQAVFSKFFHALLKRGIYLPASQYECWFLSNALTYDDLDKTLLAMAESLDEIF